MTLRDDEERNTYRAPPPGPAQMRSRKCCRVVICTILVLLIVLFIIGLILALTVFKPKHPKSHITSVTVQGVSPRLSFPAIKVQLNISLDVNIAVYNPNRASFKHEQGQATLFYRGTQVGEADLDQGSIPSMGSSNVSSHLTLQIDRFGSSLTQLVSDILGGKLPLETKVRIPGKITFLGLFHKHAVATSDCQIVVGFPDLNVTDQECSYHNEF